MIVLREIAAAKINLYLHVTGKRDDSYHELDSWVAFADIGDTLQVKKSDTLQLDIDGLFAEGLAINDNSVLRAAEALAKAFNVKNGAALTLTKRLPVSAGIGGGTADAAATLRLLNRFWNLQADYSVLHRLAEGLGADVPACLRSRSLYMAGKGERIEPAPDIHWPVVLVNSGKPVATAEVFARFSQRYSTPARHPEAFDTLDAGVQFLGRTGNDLQSAAIAIAPEIETVLAALDVQPGCLLARMSGSGATCFGIFASSEEAQQASEKLSYAYPEWWLQAGHLT